MMRAIVLLQTLFLSSLLATADPGDRLFHLYRHADSLYHLQQSTHADDSIALAAFTLVADALEKQGRQGGGDTLLTMSLLKKGILLDAAGDFSAARSAYCRVLDYHPPDDSLVFVTEVLVGTAYYNLDRFDSASYYLLQAEKVSAGFNDRDNKVRLYNTLGALYCDNGNYRQGRNYFDKAYRLVTGSGKKPYDTAMAVSLQINIGTASFRLGQYDRALVIYRGLLGYRPLRDYVYENMGRAYAGMEEYGHAMEWFRRVKAAQVPAVYNEMASAELQLHHPDSCEWFLQQLQEYARKGGVGVHPLDMGINALYHSEELRQRNDLQGARASVQTAIALFARNFNKRDAYANPVRFTGALTYYRLFDALVLKAELYQQAYEADGKENDLQAAYATYTAALSLLRYVEKSYATDESKLFLKKKSSPVHGEALSVCLRLSRLHPEGDYLQKAFLIGENSKASVITASLKEKDFLETSGPERDLLQKVDNCKYHIARLDLRSEGTTDAVALAAIVRQKEDAELELLRLQKALEQDGEYYREKYGDADTSIRPLQEELKGSQALVSLYAAGNILHVFVVTKDGLRHVAIDSLSRVMGDVEQWLDALKTTGNGRRFSGEIIGRRLYAELVKPIQDVVKDKTEWVIVPDGVFALLPFESLYANEEGSRYLVETTTISYRFSSRLLSAGGDDEGMKAGVLAFAPFVHSGNGAELRPLPASAEEIAGLPGVQYLDGQATKEQFLSSVNRYPIVHLATHALSSVDNAAASYIAFYPVTDSVAEDNLFLEELYGLNLRGTRLAIISACESGMGEVAPQEGVISLARAFAYAGCGSTINSLWRADDQATSMILRRFYVYLRRGETKARALQLAKIDFLNGDAVDKSPAYWAHLVLTGDSGALYPNVHWIGWGMGGLALFIVVAAAFLIYSLYTGRAEGRKRTFP